MLVWIDLETTGLDFERDAILEVAAVVTTDELVEVASFEAVTSAARAYALDALHPNVQEMHLGNGLWIESIAAGRPVREVGEALVAFIREHGAQGAQLAGSGVHFDRAFLRAQMRPAHDLLHYRNVCMSTLYETARRFWPQVAGGGPRPDGRHRAMPDIRASIATYRYYLEAVGPTEPARKLIETMIDVVLPALSIDVAVSK